MSRGTATALIVLGAVAALMANVFAAADESCFAGDEAGAGLCLEPPSWLHEASTVALVAAAAALLCMVALAVRERRTAGRLPRDGADGPAG